MSEMKIADFAKQVNCTPANIYKHLNTKGELFAGTTRKDGSGTWLSDEAQEKLRQLMKSTYNMEKDSEITELKSKVNELQEDVIKKSEAIKALQEQLIQSQQQTLTAESELERETNRRISFHEYLKRRRS